ncbi:MAG TPA: type II CAAX endopeptidase family protein [Solirubrobacter sp.]|nr:type II CAAX endopeptidase family protein [Solirubrobacter sp.]
MIDQTEPQEPVKPTIPAWLPFVALLVVLVVVNTFSVVIVGIATAMDPSIDVDELPNGLTLVLMAVQNIGFIFGAWIAVRLALNATPPEQFGLRRVRGIGRAIGLAAAVYGAFWFVTVVLTLAFGQPDEQALVSDLKDEDSLGALIAFAVLLCVVAPIAEELFFRGFMYTILAPRIGYVWAALLVGTLFGLGHAFGAELIAVVALSAFGIGLCVLYWRTQSIIPCMALHALNNSITFGVVKDPSPLLFAGVVVASVGIVTLGAHALSARPRAAA